MTAYAAGRYDDALREFRTFRRITGSSIHLPHMADCERGLGRPEKALELARSDERNMLDTADKVELAIVASGARRDMGDFAGAVEELEIPQLDINRAFSFSPRLFEAYADALTAAGRADEAAKWYRQIGVAESALGVGEFAEPDILDFGDEEGLEGDDADRYVGAEDEEEERAEGPDGEEAGLAEDEIGVTEHDETELPETDLPATQPDETELPATEGDGGTPEGA